MMYLHSLIFTPQLAGEAHQLGYPKIVLTMCVLHVYNVHTTMLKYSMRQNSLHTASGSAPDLPKNGVIPDHNSKDCAEKRSFWLP